MKRFYLYHTDLQQPVKIAAPVGWDGLNKTIRRNRTLHGVFFDYTPKLQFVKDGKAIIHNLYEQYGPEAEIILVIMERNEVSRVWEKEYEGRLNLLTFKVSEIYAECNVESTGFRQRFMNAEEVRFDIGSVPVTLHSKVLRKAFKARPRIRPVFGDLVFTIQPNEYHQFDWEVIDIDEIEERFNYPSPAGGNPNRPDENFRFEYDGLVSFVVEFLVRQFSIGGDPTNFKFYLQKNDDAVVPVPIISTCSENVNLHWTRRRITTSISFAKGDRLRMYAKNEGAQDVLMTLEQQPDVFVLAVCPTFVGTCLVELQQDTVAVETSATSELVFEALDKVVENMVGSPARLRSSFYGRTDSSRVYASDGPGSLKAVTSGLNIRGKEVLTANWKDLFKTLQVVDNVGCGIRKEGTIEVVDVEHFSHFYAPRQVLRLDYVSDLAKEVDETLYHNEVETGYSKWANEKISNLDEFNSKREWQLPVTQAKKRMNLVAPYVASGYTIEFLKRETEDSKDSRTDNDNFLIVVRRDGTDWVAAKDEGFASVTGVISPETAYNLSITPARILRTHGAHLRSFLNKQQAEQIIARFSEGNNGLVTQLTGGDSVAENGSVLVADLPQPVYLAEVYTFRKKLTRADLTALQNDPYGYISFSETNQNHQRMFLLEAVRDAESKEVRFRGLRANV